MAVNKIIYNKQILIDLTNDTVTADKLFKGVLAHDKSGNQIVGTFEQSLPTGTKTITANGTYDVTDYAKATVNVPVPSGYVKPSGTKYITTTSSVDVTSYATAQIQSSTLTAENIKKGVNILGTIGTYEGTGGGGGVETCTFTNRFTSSIISYVNNKNELVLNAEIGMNGTITCAKNSILYIFGPSSMCTLTGAVTLIKYLMSAWVLYVYGDGSIASDENGPPEV